MATSNPQIPFSSANITDFKAWGSAISAAISGFGFVASSDTGQVNWSTIVSPPTAGNFVYEIWKPNDSLASTFTYYIKIEYGTSSGSPAAPTLRISVGTATNGSGTLSGNVSSLVPLEVTNGVGLGATTWDSYLSGDSGGRLNALLWRNASTSGDTCAFGIERSLDSTGAYTAGYITLWALSGGSGGVIVQHIWPTGLGTTYTVTTSTSSMPVIGINPAGNTLAVGSNTAAIVLCPLVGRMDNPITSLICLASGDQIEGGQFTIQMYGSTRNYVFSKTSANLSLNNLKPAFRYD